MNLSKGDIVRLRSPRHKVNLEHPWYCDNWERLTPFVFLGPCKDAGGGFGNVMDAEGGVHLVWQDDLTTRMRRVW